jgi:hypothetical protein
MTTLHMFFFCSFIFLIFKGLDIFFTLQRYNIGKREKELRGVARKNVEIRGITGNYYVVIPW